jgi:hypothetical protein
MNPDTGKLVRDTIPQFIRADGFTSIIRVGEPDEYRDLLLAKLREETIAASLGLEPDQIDRTRAAKLETNGGFSGRIVWLGNTEDASGQPL